MQALLLILNVANGADFCLKYDSPFAATSYLQWGKPVYRLEGSILLTTDLTHCVLW